MNDTADRAAEIERRIDRDVAGAIALSGHPSGAVTIAPKNMSELLEFAKVMAVSGPMIRPLFRGNPGACLAVCMQAFKWNADPFSVANKAYIVRNKAGEDQVAYESQLIHAIVNTRAPLANRLRASFAGDGATLKCTVTGYLKGESEPFEYVSPTVGQIVVKNSPLWTADPQQQLWYYSTRAWARRYVPEILLGIYSNEELEGTIVDLEPAEYQARPDPAAFAETGPKRAPRRQPAAKAAPPELKIVEPERTDEPKADHREEEGVETTPPEEEKPELYWFADQHGVVMEFLQVAEAIEMYGDLLDSLRDAPEPRAKLWEGGETFMARLTAEGEEAAVERLTALAIVITKPPQPQLPPEMEPRPASASPYFIPHDGKAMMEWYKPARAKLEAMVKAKEPPENFRAFAEANDEALAILKGPGPNAHQSVWQMLDARIREQLGRRA